MYYNCKKCEKKFDSIKGLHHHLKAHKITLGDYYVENYPRYNKLTGNLLPFKNRDEYFDNDFLNRSQLIDWCESASHNEVKKYITEIAQKRIVRKQYVYMPPHIELENKQMPSIDIYKKHFGSFTSACEEIGFKPMFGKNMPQEFYQDFDVEVLVDTREQKPLKFKKSKSLKLDFGDYTLAGNLFNNTFVDRKNASDFLGTFGSQVDRFEREMNRCVELDAFMFIVVEDPLDKIQKQEMFQTKRAKRSSKFKWVLSNVLDIQHKFPRNCQFVFANDRTHCQQLVLKLLGLGPRVWEVDVQYFIDREN